jgi:hypothetical protein
MLQCLCILLKHAEMFRALEISEVPTVEKTNWEHLVCMKKKLM